MQHSIRERLIRYKLRRTELFDAEWYRRENGLPKEMDPWKHYLEGGWRESDPSPLFRNQLYLEANRDVKDLDICPLEHYLLYGEKEGRRLFTGQVPGKRWRYPAKEAGELPELDYPAADDLISVVIPAYNRAATIFASVNSVLKQTWKNLEVIVVDDGSEDETEQLIRGLRDPRVRYERHEKNLGACAARNTGIRIARGTWIAFQDSDDLWLPEKLETQLRAVKQTESDVCFCQYLRKSPDGSEELGPLHYYPRGIQERMESVFAIGTQTLLIRTEILRKERFDPEMPRFQDLELCMRLAESCRFCYCDEPMVIYRTGANSISGSTEKLLMASRLLWEKHPDMRERYPLLCRQLACLLLNTAEKEKGDFRKRLCAEALRMDDAREIRRMEKRITSAL